MNVPTPLYILHGTECRRLHAQGMTIADIARQVGTSTNTVAYALMDAAGRAKVIARKKADKEAGLGRVHTPPAKPKQGRPLPMSIISKEDKNAAVLAFAKHDIPLAEMMRRITPREKWRAEWRD